VTNLALTGWGCYSHPPAQLVVMAAHTTNQPDDDSPWLIDNAANLHLTPALEKLQVTRPYVGSGAIVMGNGSGLQIMNIGSLSFQIPNATLHIYLESFIVLQLLPIFCSLINFAKIINVSSFSLTQCFIKDNHTSKTLLEDRSEGGLYPITTIKATLNKSRIHMALLSIKAFASVAFKTWPPTKNLVDSHSTEPIKSKSTKTNTQQQTLI
jgi:hypothetical protein